MAVVRAEMSIGSKGGAGIGCQQWWRKYLVEAIVVRVASGFSYICSHLLLTLCRLFPDHAENTCDYYTTSKAQFHLFIISSSITYDHTSLHPAFHTAFHPKFPPLISSLAYLFFCICMPIISFLIFESDLHIQLLQNLHSTSS